MKENFNESLEIILDMEGRDKTSDHPADKGGLTKWGISQNAHPELDIRSLTYEQAGEIYRTKYWDAVEADQLPAPIDLIVFDMAVNHGPGHAGRFLQSSINSLLPILGQRVALKVDGAIGPVTLARLHDLEARNTLAVACVARELLLRRTRFYTRLIGGDKSQRVFVYGWLRQRVVNIAVKAGVFSPHEAM